MPQRGREIWGWQVQDNIIALGADWSAAAFSVSDRRLPRHGDAGLRASFS